jgi:hypothetical protein
MLQSEGTISSRHSTQAQPLTRSSKGSASLIKVLSIAISLGMVLYAATGNAQILYGNLTGTVHDRKGAVIASAKVTATDVNTGISHSATTNRSGDYTLNDLQPGTYKVLIDAASFQSSETTSVALSANTTVRVDGSLGPASVDVSVDVTGASPQLQTESADVHYEITSEQIENLPTTSSVGRSFQSLYELIPGVSVGEEQNSVTANPGRAMAFSVNGGSLHTNSTRVDGVAVDYPWLPALIAYMPSSDSIGSINVTTASFNADQGTAGGAAINIQIKSGTNNFHGGVWEYNSINQFDARDYFTRASTVPQVPKNIYNEYGGNLGGPIFKNKLFFFFGYNHVSQRQNSSGFQTIIPNAVRGGDFTSTTAGAIYDPTTGTATGANRTAFPTKAIPQSRLSMAALKLVALLPNADPTKTTNNYYASNVYQYDRSVYDAKINYQINPTTSAFARYSVQLARINDPSPLGAAGGNPTDGGIPGISNSNIPNIGIGITHVFTPNLLIDANAGYARVQNSSDGPLTGVNFGLDTLGIPGTNGPNPLQGGIPYFSFSQGLSPLGNAQVSSPFSFRDNGYVGNVNLTYVHATHDMRFGGEYTHYAINHFQTNGQSPRGHFAFNGGATASNGQATPGYYHVIEDFLMGEAFTVGKSTQITIPNTMRWSSFAFYAEDRWKAMSNLTVNYGIRYEYYPVATKDHSGLYRWDPSTDNVIIGGKGGNPVDTGIKNGWGIIVPRLGLNYRATDKAVFRTGFGITVDPSSFKPMRDAYPAIIDQSNQGANTYLPGGTLVTGIPPTIIPDTNVGTIRLPGNVGTHTVAKDFRRGYISSWNAFIDQDMGKGLVFTIGYVGTHGTRPVAGLDLNTSPIGTNQAGMPFNNAAGNFNTNSLDEYIPYGRTNYNALQAQLMARQWKTFQFGIAYTWSHALNFVDDTGGLIPDLEFTDPKDTRSNYANSEYDRTNSISLWTVHHLPWGTGRQYLSHGWIGAVVGDWDLSNTIRVASGKPFSLTDTTFSTYGNTQTPIQLSKPRIYKINGGANQFQYFDAAAFALGGNVTAGNVGRNSMRGPGYFNWNLGLSRGFRLSHHSTFMFRADALHVTNTPQFNVPASNIGAGAFGKVTGANGARELRLSARLRF